MNCLKKLSTMKIRGSKWTNCKSSVPLYFPLHCHWWHSLLSTTLLLIPDNVFWSRNGNLDCFSRSRGWSINPDPSVFIVDHFFKQFIKFLQIHCFIKVVIESTVSLKITQESPKLQFPPFWSCTPIWIFSISPFTKIIANKYILVVSRYHPLVRYMY